MIIEAGLYKRCGAENTALPNLLRFGFRSTPLSFTAFLKAIYRLKSPDVSRSLAFADRIPVSKIILWAVLFLAAASIANLEIKSRSL